MEKESKYSIASHGVVINLPDDTITLMDNTPYIKFSGLMYAVDKVGTFNCDVELVKDTDDEKVMKCTAWLESKDNATRESVVMFGSANKSNLRPAMQRYMYEMANTRAVVRALRVLLKCPFTAVDEMADISKSSHAKTDSTTKKKANTNDALRGRYLDKIAELMCSSPKAKTTEEEYLKTKGHAVLQELTVDEAKELYALCDKVTKG